MDIAPIQSSGVMAPIESSKASSFQLTVTHPAHMQGSNEITETGSSNLGNTLGNDSNFVRLLTQSLDAASTLDKEATQLSYQAVLDPESVNDHEVVLAAQKAEMAISITKSIVDRAIEAYRTIIALR